MKKVKAGIAIVVSTIIIYFVVSYGVPWFRSLSVGLQLQSGEVKSIKQTEERLESKDDSLVVIQNEVEDRQCSDDFHKEPQNLVEFTMNGEPKKSFPLIMAEEQRKFILSRDAAGDKEPVKLDSYSFVTMPIVDDYKIDKETQYTLDTLIGKDLDEFVKLVLQSNNNIVSKEACRSCGMYAFFKAIKKHKTLNAYEVVTLQQILSNLYKFIENMKKLSNTSLMLSEQYNALQDLNRSQAVKNDIKLRKRKAATSAALKKLQSIKYNN